MLAARHNAAVLRREIEERLAERVPAALTGVARTVPERLACGVRALDERLRGGLPAGALTELVGAECSGRTTMALAYVAAAVQQGNVAAWIDVDDVFDPESAAQSGVNCARLLWVRCGHTSGKAAEPLTGTCTQLQSASCSASGQPAPTGGGGSPHPRLEGRGMPQAISELLSAQPRSSALPARRRDKSIGTPGAPNRPLPDRAFDREEQIATDRLPPRRGAQLARVLSATQREHNIPTPVAPATPPAVLPHDTSQEKKRAWTRLDQALRATDLLLQSAGFSLIVLDLGSTPADKSWRIPLTTWFRFRAACERTRASLVLLTRHPCARSSAELVVRMSSGRLEAEGNVLTGIAFHAEVERQRFERPANNVIPIRKPPQSERPGTWRGKSAWAI